MVESKVSFEIILPRLGETAYVGALCGVAADHAGVFDPLSSLPENPLLLAKGVRADALHVYTVLALLLPYRPSRKLTFGPPPYSVRPP
jgi:hypothetical protein